MDLKEKTLVTGPRPPRRRGPWWAAAIVLGASIAVICFVLSRGTGPGQTPAPHPYPLSLNDKPGELAETGDQSSPNRPEELPDPELVEFVSSDVIKRAQEILPEKISRPRGRLLHGLAKETTLQSIENLPNFDDTAPAEVMAMGGAVFPQRSYEFLRRFVPRLSRVRKILQETGNNPHRDEIVAMLIQKLEYSYKDFQNAHHKRVRTEPSERDRKMTYAQAATYLLSELHAYQALPLMSKVYHCRTKIPVSRLFVFYAMHLLVKDHPRANLSPESNKALDAYLEKAKDLPAPEIDVVASSKAAYDEDDFRVTILGEDLLKHQPKIQMRLYPQSLIEFEEMRWDRPNSHPHRLAVDPKIEDLCKYLDVFIEAAYPESQ